jgi:uncharacterized sulfatase
MDNRNFLLKLLACIVSASAMSASLSAKGKVPERPNILFAISDDQSWLHTSTNGSKAVRTPAFDRVAAQGILFRNAFAAAPQCSPDRAAILTGRSIWQLEEAGTHASNFPAKFRTYPDILKEQGYRVGYTGKGWGPGNWKINGRKTNPAGPAFNRHRTKKRPTPAISDIDYAANFEEFLDNGGADGDKPFCFWYGGKEPHRTYQKGSGLKAGKKPADVAVPPFLPDTPEIRSDILDYMLEIEWFDEHLGRMLKSLEDRGLLDNTLVVVTSDNGMPFPRAKANLYEYGIHMPLAISWPKVIRTHRAVDDMIGFVDFAPTFLEVAGIAPPGQMSGKSFLDILRSSEQGIVDDSRKFILAGRERHTHARPDNLGYPSRVIRTRDYLYVWNVKPDRWPAGDPTGSGEPEGYHDIDPSPSKTFMLANRETFGRLFALACDKRPEEELYDIAVDPGCLNNLAETAKFDKTKSALRKTLKDTLKRQGDPRMLGRGDIFESYPRYSAMRPFPGFKKRGQYNPKFQVK